MSPGQAAEWVRRSGAWVAVALVTTLATARHPQFLTFENLMNIARQSSMLAVVALGMTFVILAGGIDLSVGAVVAVAGVLAGELTPHGSLVAIVAGVGGATVLGLVNGALVVRGRLPPFIATLGTMFAARGAVLVWTEEASVRVDRAAPAMKWLGRGVIGPVPVPVIVVLVCFAAGWVVLTRTRFGRHVFAVGDNAEAARLMGLNVSGVSLAVYALSGALSGIAGVLLAARLGAAQPVAGSGWELDAIAAVVVGGTLLAGGQGGAWPTLAGVLLLGMAFNVINLEGTISSYWQSILRGTFLLAIIVAQNRLAAAGRRSRRG